MYSKRSVSCTDLGLPLAFGQRLMGSRLAHVFVHTLRQRRFPTRPDEAAAALHRRGRADKRHEVPAMLENGAAGTLVTVELPESDDAPRDGAQ